MKVFIFLFFITTTLAEAKTVYARSGAVAIATVNNLDQTMADGLENKIAECFNLNVKLCRVKLNSKMAQTLQDYLSLTTEIPSTLKKGHLEMDLTKSLTCKNELETLRTLPVRYVEDKQISFVNLMSHRDVFLLCAKNKAVNIYLIGQYDSDIENKTDFAAMSPKHMEEYNKIVKMINSSSLIKQAVEEDQIKVAVLEQSRFGRGYHYESRFQKMPTNILVKYK